LCNYSYLFIHNFIREVLKMNPLLTVAKVQQAAINPYRFVKNGSVDHAYVQAVDGASPIVGVSGELDNAVLGQRVDIAKVGIAQIKLGGSVTRGQQLTADANGCGVAANLVAGTTVYYAGTAEESGVAGDIVELLFCPGVLHNDSLIAVKDTTISSAELLALNATAKELIPAPGANKAIIVLGAMAFLDYNSAAYDGIASGEDIVLAYTNVSGTALAKFEATGFLSATADAVRYATPTQSADTNLTPTANAPLVAALLVGEVATGNSPLKIRVWYRIIDTVL
jgi:hypothetical protein